MTVTADPPPEELSPSEVELRRRAVVLVGQHWSELSQRIRQWLGTAYREDDTLASEVALVIMRRAASGHGLATVLRAVEPGSAEEKAMLFKHASWVSREIVKTASRERHRRRAERPDLEDAYLTAPVTPSASEGAGPLPTSNEVGGRHRRDKPVGDQLDAGDHLEALDALLAAAEWVWDGLCREGVLDPSDWTEDQRVTALGMACGLSVKQIAALRGARLAEPTRSPPNIKSTSQMMYTIREKGKALLKSMPDDQRRLLGYRHEDVVRLGIKGSDRAARAVTANRRMD